MSVGARVEGSGVGSSFREKVLEGGPRWVYVQARIVEGNSRCVVEVMAGSQWRVVRLATVRREGKSGIFIAVDPKQRDSGNKGVVMPQLGC